MIRFLTLTFLRLLNQTVRRNALLTWCLFGVRARTDRRIHWDFTTLVLRECLARRVRPWHRVLEVGTGPYGILAIPLVKRGGCDVVACDISESYVESARDTARRNGVSLDVVQSDLLGAVCGQFDIIFFNSVYIPREVGRALGIDRFHERESDWCGGETGMETIVRFLSEAGPHLKRGGEVLLGFNSRYLRTESVVKRCLEKGYGLKTLCRSAWNPSRVLVIRKEPE